MRQPLTGDVVHIGAAADADVHFPADAEPEVDLQHATLEREGQTYMLSADSNSLVLVNGEPVSYRRLVPGDTIRLGNGGPVFRFRIYAGSGTNFKTIPETLKDCGDCARLESKTMLGQGWHFLKAMPPEIMLRTSVWSRIVVLSILFVLVATVGLLTLRTFRLENQLGNQVLQGVNLRKQSAQNSLSLNTLQDVREKLEQRVDALEVRSTAGEHIIADAARSVVFIQGSYAFIDPVSRDTLHLIVDMDGHVRTDSKGSPFVTTLRDGPLLERMFTGSGFVAGRDGRILTNRHIALPWEFDKTAKALVDKGYKPFMQRLIGYLPKSTKPFSLHLVAASKTADVAMLHTNHLPPEARALPISSSPAQPGQEVYVLGYPTGMRALIVRTSEAFVDSLKVASRPDFWHIARQLADGGHIAPLATRGIVGQATETKVVYDAETTNGGSGGPVIGLDGTVQAINSAIMVDFAGSNMGVPAREARLLLKRTTHHMKIEHR